MPPRQDKERVAGASSSILRRSGLPEKFAGTELHCRPDGDVLEPDAHAETDHPLVDSFPSSAAVRGRDAGIAAQTLDSVVAVQDHVRDIAAGVRKMGRVG